MPYPRQELDIVEDTSIGAWFATSKPVARAAMLANVFRFGAMPQSDRAFIDAVIPGHNRILMGALGRGTADENLKPQPQMNLLQQKRLRQKPPMNLLYTK